MKRSTLASIVAGCLCLGLTTPLLAAETPVTGAVKHPPPSEKRVSATKPAAKCLSDLRAFDAQMEKDGHWLGGSGYGYGYPMAGYGYPMGRHPSETTTAYLNARPGYDVRMLVAAANILARHGEQQSCERVLATTRKIYKIYVADMKSGDLPRADVPAWRNQEIAAAQPVTSGKSAFRSDELIGIDVRNAQNEALGSVDDFVMSPKTGKIAYLVIAQGGIFGIGEKYVPVPWDNFKVTPDVNLLVLDTTKGVMDAAPQVSNDQFAASGQFEQESQKVDSYWKAHPSNGVDTPPKG